MGKHLTWRTV